jgi:ribosome maturation factor RimP
MLTKDEIEEVIGSLAEKRGLRVYDIDLPRGRRGVLRVFVCKGAPKLSQITLDECAALSQDIIGHDVVESILPGEVRLEVSSPGVNRKLSSSQHFEEAVGERIRVKIRGAKEDAEDSAGSVVGILEGFEEGVLALKEEGSEVLRKIETAAIRSAHVDFPFD